MSSLLQHGGRIDARGVHIVAYLNPEGFTDTPTTSEWWRRVREGFEPAACASCSKLHPKLYTFLRKPVGMLGCWAQFRINGETRAPDLSVPLALPRLPRDARPMSAEDSARYWHTN